MHPKNANSRCQGQTKRGKLCRAAATEGGLCFFHANPNKASELGRIGGLRNRHVDGESADPLPKLDNAAAVRDTVARLIADVYAGRLHPRTAAGLAPLMHLQLRAIEKTNLEQRMVRVEKLLGHAIADGYLSNSAEAASQHSENAQGSDTILTGTTICNRESRTLYEESMHRGGS
jgi:hypothetical protein